MLICLCRKNEKKVTLKRDKSVLKEVTDYAVGQLEKGMNGNMKRSIIAVISGASDLDNCGKKYLCEI
ncbi:MAG: hypothetical protein ACLTER_11355 [Ruminococcus sp.]